MGAAVLAWPWMGTASKPSVRSVSASLREVSHVRVNICREAGAGKAGEEERVCYEGPQPASRAARGGTRAVAPRPQSAGLPTAPLAGAPKNHPPPCTWRPAARSSRKRGTRPCRPRAQRGTAAARCWREGGREGGRERASERATRYSESPINQPMDPIILKNVTNTKIIK